MSSPAPSSIPSAPAPESLRERRKRELRQHLSDTATHMFLAHGFDAVRVVDVAQACGVTEATVFNHFPTKEALLVDRWDATIEQLCSRLLDTSTPPVDTALSVLHQELDFLLQPRQGRTGFDPADLQRFSELVRSTPALLAREREALDRLIDAAGASLAERSGTSSQDPEPVAIASALAGLWHVFRHSLQRHLTSGEADAIRLAVVRDLETGANRLRRGIPPEYPDRRSTSRRS